MILLYTNKRVHSYRKNAFRKELSIDQVFHCKLHQNPGMSSPRAAGALSSLSPEPRPHWTEKVHLALVHHQPEAAAPPDTDVNMQGGVQESRGPWPSWKAATGPAGAGGCRKWREKEAALLSSPAPSSSQEVRQMSSGEYFQT